MLRRANARGIVVDQQSVIPHTHSVDGLMCYQPAAMHQMPNVHPASQLHEVGDQPSMAAPPHALAAHHGRRPRSSLTGASLRDQHDHVDVLGYEGLSAVSIAATSGDDAIELGPGQPRSRRQSLAQILGDLRRICRR